MTGAAGPPDRGPGSRARQWFQGRRAVRTQGWRHTDALVRGVACGLGLVVAGVVLHRLELLLIGAPLLVGVLITAKPAGRPSVVVGRHADTVETGSASTVSVLVEPGPDAVFTALRMPVASRSGVGPVHLLPAVRGEVRARITWHRWGQTDYLRPDHLMAAHDGLYVNGPVVGPTANHTVLPSVSPIPAAPLPTRVAGLVGAHRSARPGDGAELRDIRPFQAGDRLRRVDWRVSLRTAAARGGVLGPDTLHVRERHAESDADLLLALDTTQDVGADIGGWSELHPGAQARVGGSIDTGVAAVASLAAAFLRQGDRVGLIDLGHQRGGVPLGSGLRQLQRIRHALVRSAQRVAGAGEPMLRAGQIAPGATLVVLSPFLDDTVVELTVRAARRGTLVLALDLLPANLVPDPASPWGPAVRGIIVAEQRQRLAVLAEHGVAVLRWDQGTPLGPVLRSARRRPRVRR